MKTLLLLFTFVAVSFGITACQADNPPARDFFSYDFTPVGIVAGIDSPMLIMDDGSLWGFGWFVPSSDQAFNQFPIYMRSNVIAASGNSHHMFVITSEYELWAWGDNTLGHLMDDIIHVSTSRTQTLAVTADNVLLSWGAGSLAPQRIMECVIAAEVGAGESFAITSDNTLWTWGTNPNARVQVKNDVIAVASDNGFTFAITADNTLWDLTDEPTPLMENIISVSTNAGHTMALTEDGIVWHWGDTLVGNYFGADNSHVIHTYQNPIKLVHAGNFYPSEAVMYGRWQLIDSNAPAFQEFVGNSPLVFEYFFYENNEVVASVREIGDFVLTPDPAVAWRILQDGRLQIDGIGIFELTIIRITNSDGLSNRMYLVCENGYASRFVRFERF